MSESLRPITVYDTARQTKVVLEPQEPGKIKMYVCGVTVYDLTHIGHARVFVFFDSVQRFLRHLGYEVTYVRNHTDVDDKIIKRAEEKGIDPLELSAQFIRELDADMGALGLERPDVEPKVSDHIEEIIAMVQTLVEKGFAYESQGDVYYRVSKFEEYGKLSHRKLEDMEAGRSGRVDETDRKEHPFDFALWKASEADELGWASPFGYGRPGWHIECSAMSMKYLGETLDIHGGGRDLIFPHHENEIAQSEASTGCAPFAKYWMHVGMVNVAEKTEEGERIERKMSKSLGNFWTTRDVLKSYHPEAIRYFMHTTCYRNPITYAVENLEEATLRVTYLYKTLQCIDQALSGSEYEGKANTSGTEGWKGEYGEFVETFLERAEAEFADDFVSPRVLARLGEAARYANEIVSKFHKDDASEYHTLVKVRELLVTVASWLGLLGREPSVVLEEINHLRLEAMEIDAEQIEERIAARKQARADRDWAKADELRDELDALGVEIMDSPEGTTWRMK